MELHTIVVYKRKNNYNNNGNSISYSESGSDEIGGSGDGLNSYFLVEQRSSRLCRLYMLFSATLVFNETTTATATTTTTAIVACKRLAYRRSSPGNLYVSLSLPLFGCNLNRNPLNETWRWSQKVPPQVQVLNSDYRLLHLSYLFLSSLRSFSLSFPVLSDRFYSLTHRREYKDKRKGERDS